MKVCIEQVEGGFRVYQEDGAAPAAAPAQPGMPSANASDGQTVASVDEALQLAGSMLGGSAAGEEDEGAEAEQQAQALFQSGFDQARGPR